MPAKPKQTVFCCTQCHWKGVFAPESDCLTVRPWTECPKCGKRVLHVNVEHIVGLVDGSSKARCLSYSCIHCNTILGVQIDPRSKPRLRSSKPPAAS